MKHGGKFKPYSSPGHVHDHPAHNLADPSGGMMTGDSMAGGPMPPGSQMEQGQAPGLGGM